MTDTFEDMERRLRAALAPIEPPVHLQRHLEETLDSIVELAADELEAWELSAIKDPRNVRAATRERHKRRAAAHGVRDLAARTLRDATREAKKVFDDLAPDR
jgi:hypothetical protein